MSVSSHCFIRVVFINVVTAPNVIQLRHAFSIAVHSTVNRACMLTKKILSEELYKAIHFVQIFFKIIVRVVDNFKVQSSLSSVYIAFWNLGFILLEFTMKSPGVTLAHICGVMRRKQERFG